MVKCLLPMERKWVAQTMCPGERELIPRKPHYAPLHKAKSNRTPAVWVWFGKQCSISQ
jgi:hypothetical protein